MKVHPRSILLFQVTGFGLVFFFKFTDDSVSHKLLLLLLFSYKPVDNKLIWLPLRESFEELFSQTFSRKKNQTFLGHIQTCYRQKRWHDLLKLMQHIHKSAINKEVKENASGKT